MCLVVYLAADRPLPPVEKALIGVEPAKLQRRNRDLFAEPHRYRYLLGTPGPGCACDLLSDGLTDDEEQARRALLDDFYAYITEAVRLGPVEAFVCWAGDEKKEARTEVVTPKEFRDFDFGRAWDAPTRLAVRNRYVPFSAVS
jgi:hypothetical protein